MDVRCCKTRQVHIVWHPTQIKLENLENPMDQFDVLPSKVRKILMMQYGPKNQLQDADKRRCTFCVRQFVS